jgi:hypothetical protein
VEELLRDTVSFVREIWQGSAKRVDIRGARYIMGAMEDWAGGSQLQHSLYGLRGIDPQGGCRGQSLQVGY